MKAKVLHDFYNENPLKDGTIVEIQPGMEADGADVFNAPVGKCYLCKCSDGTCRYITATCIQMLDSESGPDWEQRRYEIAKEILPFCAKLSSDILNRGYSLGDGAKGKTLAEHVAECAVTYADALIAELRKPQQEPKTESNPERKDVAIGEVVEFQGEYLLCVEKTDGDDCTGCAFLSKGDDCKFSGYCSKDYRKDGKNVIFLKGGKQ